MIHDIIEKADEFQDSLKKQKNILENISAKCKERMAQIEQQLILLKEKK